MTGKSYRGSKVGLWKELSTDGITYAENWYDSAGNRTGTWNINFPDGSLRYVIDYSANKPIKWAMFRYKRKVAEISCDSGMTDDVFKRIDKFENDLFELEKFSLEKWHTGYRGTAYQGMDGYQFDPYKEVEDIPRILKSEKFTGSLVIWNIDNTINCRNQYTEGSEYKISYFYNKKKELTKQEEYQDGGIIKAITYKSNSEQKVKTY